MKKYRFKFRIGFFILCSFFTTLFCFLGVWQLHRYHFKKELLASYQERIHAAPKPFSEATQQAFQNVSVNGRYLNQFTVLMQNQFYQDRLGFEVLTPLKIPGQNKLLLVDRGWVAAVQNQMPPPIENAQGEQHIKGYIKLLNEYQFILGDNLLNPKASPLVVQKIDVSELSRVTGQSYWPFILRLDASQLHGFTRDWTVSAVLPERHMGYAVQWFALAVMMLIAFSCFCFEKIEENNDGKK